MSDNSAQDGGLPEPQIGPSQFVEQATTDGGGDCAVSQDSLNQSMSRPTSPPPNSAEGSRRTSRASSRRSSRSSNRVLYQPQVDREAITPRSGPIENPFELKENHIQPLVSAGQREATWVDAVIENIMPQLKAKLKEEFERDRIDMENEHERRLKELHEIHQSEQFELYEKNVALYEKIALLERRIKSMNQSTGRLQARMEAQSEKTIKLRALTQWRQATREKIEEKKLSKLSSMMYKRLLMRRYFNQWASAVKSKWKSKVEKVCKERATEICLKLKDELTSEINRLKCEVDNRDTIIGEMENKQQRYEEGLSKALMRGVCALNMEAMSVLNNPDFQVEDIEQVPAPIPQPSNEPQKAKRAPLLAPQNSQSNIMTTSGRPQSANPYHQLSRPASNVFIDTVNSLEDITTKKKIKARNSSEKLANTLGTRSENLSKSVRVERHQGAKKVTTQTLPAKPEGKKPWIPASVKILNCENQKLRKEKQKFSAVKHVG